jgi:hypothetical protein
MLIINRLINALEILKDDFSCVLENRLKLDSLILKPALFILLFVLLMFEKIFAFQASLTMMVILDFLNDLLISLGKFK